MGRGSTTKARRTPSLRRGQPRITRHGGQAADDTDEDFAYLQSSALLMVEGRSRCGFAHFKLCAHLLQAGSERSDLFLLLRKLGLKVLLQLRDGRLVLVLCDALSGTR